MALTNSFRLLAFGMILLLSSCDRPHCTNTNPVLNRNFPESEAYKQELARQLEVCDRSKLTFWFSRYLVNNGEEILMFNVQGGGLCALVPFRVEDWSGLEELRRKQGISFRGAEFKGVRFAVLREAGHVGFLLQDFSDIID